jgi:hypothetical protein
VNPNGESAPDIFCGCEQYHGAMTRMATIMARVSLGGNCTNDESLRRDPSEIYDKLSQVN